MKKKIKGRMKRVRNAATGKEYGMSEDQTGTKKAPTDTKSFAHSGSGEPKQTASHGATGK